MPAFFLTAPSKKERVTVSYDVKLKQVARLCDHTLFDIPKRELGARRGPFPYYGDLFERFEVDDYSIDAPSVIFMAAAGKVVERDGFRVAIEHGPCGSNGFAHVVVPFDPADADYIFSCMAFHPHAVDYIGGANQLQTLDELAVLRLALPWPAPATRQAFVSRLRQLSNQVDDVRAEKKLLAAEQAPQDEALACEKRLYEATQARDIFVNDFMEFGIMGDFDCSPTMPDFGSQPASYSDGRAERARRELSQLACDQAAAEGGIPVNSRLASALGCLGPLVATDTLGLTGEDVAWELGPLAVMRACSTCAQWARLPLREETDQAALVGALDGLMAELAAGNPLLALLPNLSYESSVLDFARLLRWCLALDAVDPARITSSCIRAVFDLALGAPSIPDQVARLIAACARAHADRAGESGFYMADVRCDSLPDLATLVEPQGKSLLQCRDTESLLQTCLVRAVATRGAQQSQSFLAQAPVASALLDDRFVGQEVGIALCEVTEPFQPWTDKPAPKDDPRWLFSAPTRMRSTFAWLENALAHVVEDGISINLIPTSELQTSKPVDCDIRSTLAGQGHVSAVVALPSRIWSDGRPPMSLVILCRNPSAKNTLMVDLSRLGASADLAALHPNPQRCIPDAVADELQGLLEAWIGRGECVDAQSFPCAVIARDQLSNEGFSLAPWKYILVKS